MVKHEGAPAMYGQGVVFALILAVGMLVLPVLWFEVFGRQASARLSRAVSRGDVVATHLWLFIVDPDDMAHSVLGQAAKQGNLEMVRLLLRRGADVNHRGKDGPTPFQYAASHGHLEVMRALVAAGADENDGPALRMASQGCRPEAVKLLLGQGGWTRKTPLRPEQVLAARYEAEEKGCDAVLRLLPAE